MHFDELIALSFQAWLGRLGHKYQHRECQHHNFQLNIRLIELQQYFYQHLLFLIKLKFYV